MKSRLQSTMGEGRLNALMLLHVHKDIILDYGRITDIYANRYPHQNEILKSFGKDINCSFLSDE